MCEGNGMVKTISQSSATRRDTYLGIRYFNGILLQRSSKRKPQHSANTAQSHTPELTPIQPLRRHTVPYWSIHLVVSSPTSSCRFTSRLWPKHVVCE